MDARLFGVISNVTEYVDKAADEVIAALSGESQKIYRKPIDFR